MAHLPYIDWNQAASVGRKAVHPGPELTLGHVAEVVEALHIAADKAVPYVADVSGMSTPAQAETLVVDRAGWITAMSRSADQLMDSLGAPKRPGGLADGISGKAIGLHAGGLFAVISTRILGQFDVFARPNRLLLVAPNVVSIERQLAVNPSDFRLWVCLHEQTHRFQFGQAPWLADHLRGLMKELLAIEEPLQQWRAGFRPHNLAEMVLTPAQQETFDQVTAVMSLVEGHADVMMDRVGTPVLPTLPVIRRAFEHHRDRHGAGGFVARVLGMDLKRAQYRDGAGFCRAVLTTSGLDTLNLAFTEAAALPTLTEIHDPQQWLHRVSR